MRVISMILAAGWPIWPLIVCSILALAIVIERALSLTDAKVAPPGLAQAVVEQARTHRHQVAELSIPDTRTLLGQVLASALESAKRNPEFDTQDLQSAMHQAGRKAAQTLETRLQMLATIASAAPLLGLLGTVVGMIEIFGAQSGGGASSNPAQLAHGISIALYNTAFGLIVAIPAMMFWRYFRTRADAYVLELEAAADQLLRALTQRTLP